MLARLSGLGLRGGIRGTVSPSLCRSMSTHSDVLEAGEAGDTNAVIKAFPAYLQEYRASVVPEADLAQVKSGRFDKWLRLLGRPDGDDYHKYFAAAVVDLRESDPAVCIRGSIVNAMLFRVLAEKLPPPTVLAHMRAAQLHSMALFSSGTPKTVPEHAAALETMSEEQRTAATAQDTLMRAWFHGLFTGGRGVYDNFLQGALRSTIEPYKQLLSKLPETDSEQRQQYETMIQHTKAMMFPGAEPELRPPLPELPLFGIDCDYEDFADAVAKGHFYPFLALDQQAATTAQVRSIRNALVSCIRPHEIACPMSNLQNSVSDLSTQLNARLFLSCFPDEAESGCASSCGEG